MLMPGRKYSAGSGYRYGFNGKENDNDVKGEGNQQDYGMRIYDPRLGKFLSVDPLAPKYPWYTPYQFAGNMPISAVDLDGKEPDVIITSNGKLTEPMIHLFSSVLAYDENFLRAVRFGWTNDKVILSDDKIASNLIDQERIVINRKWKDSYLGDSYELFWLNTTVHEIEHKDQTKALGKEIAFSKLFNVLIESKAYEIGDAMEKFVRGVDNYNNLFDNSWSERERTGFADYIGVSFKLNQQNSKLEGETKLLDIYKGQLKLIKSGTFPAENKESAVKDINSKIKNTSKQINKTKGEIKQTEQKKATLGKENSKIINTIHL